MQKYIFGYGSLLNTSSLSRMLGKHIEFSDVKVGYLEGFKRVWNIKEKVLFEKTGDICDALFLNIQSVPNISLNGIIVPVNDQNLSNLALREKNYNLVNVSPQIKGIEFSGEFYTVIAKEEYLLKEGDVAYLPQRYVNLVYDAARTYGDNFFKEFLESTESIDGYNKVIGTYKFIDHVQASLV